MAGPARGWITHLRAWARLAQGIRLKERGLDTEVSERHSGGSPLERKSRLPATHTFHFSRPESSGRIKVTRPPLCTWRATVFTPVSDAQRRLDLKGRLPQRSFVSVCLLKSLRKGHLKVMKLGNLSLSEYLRKHGFGADNSTPPVETNWCY